MTSVAHRRGIDVRLPEKARRSGLAPGPRHFVPDLQSESPDEGAQLAPVLADHQPSLTGRVQPYPGVVMLFRTGAELGRHVVALLALVHWYRSYPLRDVPVHRVMDTMRSRRRDQPRLAQDDCEPATRQTNHRLDSLGTIAPLFCAVVGRSA